MAKTNSANSTEKIENFFNKKKQKTPKSGSEKKSNDRVSSIGAWGWTQKKQ